MMISVNDRPGAQQLHVFIAAQKAILRSLLIPAAKGYAGPKIDSSSYLLHKLLRKIKAQNRRDSN
jgi:hypothetical protein